MANIVEFKDVSMSFGNNKVLKNIDNDEAIAEVKEEVLKLTEEFPLYKNK